MGANDEGRNGQFFETKPAPSPAVELDQSLQALLRDEQYAPLREALARAGVRTLDALKKLNLWVFMNRNALYSFGVRHEVYSALKRALNDAALNRTEARWKLATLANMYVGSSPAEALAEYCRALSSKYPLRFRMLVGRRIDGAGPVPLTRLPSRDGDVRMDEPEAYIDRELSPNSALSCAKWLASSCHDDDLPCGIYKTYAVASPAEPPTKPAEPKPEAKPAEPKPEAKPMEPKPAEASPLERRVEAAVLAADIGGITLEELSARLPGVTKLALQQVIGHSPRLVDVAGRLIHVDAFADWDAGARQLEEILEKLLAQNSGYVSRAQLYEYARAHMSLFLNDNGMDDPRKVFDLAQHLFEKVRYHGKRYVFWMKAHISPTDDPVTSTLDLARKFARERHGTFRMEELREFLERVNVGSDNLSGKMQVGVKPYFFLYSPEEFISAEAMGIDEAWLAHTRKAFERLFADVGDHIVLRAVSPIWYEQLPRLPGQLAWTPLLLQYVLKFYGEQVGARTIGPEYTRLDVLHAMLVTWDSEIECFADAVIAHLLDSGIEERQFRAKELRAILVEGGLIASNELTRNVPKAIGSDPRFAWDAYGERVNIRV